MANFYILLRHSLLSFVCVLLIPHLSNGSDNFKIYFVLRSAELPIAEKVISDPRVDGITFYIGWRKIEPRKNSFDFSGIDYVHSLVKKYNKTLNIGVLPGQWSPAWLSNVQRIDWISEDAYVDKVKQKTSSPLPWDSVYLVEFSDLVSQLGKRYDNSDNIGYIAITGPSPSNGIETNVGLNKSDFNIISYNKQKFVEAWEISIDNFSASFKHKNLSIALSNQIGTNRSSVEANLISEYAYKKIGNRFIPMLLALTHENWFDENNSYVKLATRWRGKTTIGFQMLRVYGNNSNAKEQLGIAISKAKVLGADFVEIWGKDYNNFSEYEK